jgi:hypothetical protein
MDSLDKMIFRLFLKSLVVAGLGVAILLVLGLWIPLQLSDSPMLAPLGKMAFDASLPASGAVFFVSLSMIAVQAWRLRQWHAGRGPFCHRCSGMVEEEIHRHRPCYRCLSCNQRCYV